jgi:hypothetical protein
MIRKDEIRAGWYIVGKLTKDTRPGRATTHLAQFRTQREAEAYIGERERIDPKGVAAGQYTIDRAAKPWRK